MTRAVLERLFQPRLYAQRATDRYGPGNWDFDHFVRVGLEAGISPTPYFATPAMFKDSARIVTLADWLDDPSTPPHPLVDLDLVGEQLRADDPVEILARLTAGHGRLLRLHPLFWGAEYVAAHPNGSEIRHPLHHYLQRGWRNGHEPNPFFSGEMVPGGAPDGVAPALQWLVSSDIDVVPTALFDAATHNIDTGANRSPRDAYLHFLRAGLWAEERPSNWFDLDMIRSQIGPGEQPAVLEYLRREHELRHRPSASFDPSEHPDLVRHSLPFGGRVLERFLSPTHNSQFRRRPVALSEAVAAQLDRLATIAPTSVAQIRPHLHTGNIRLNTNDFTSGRLAVLRRLLSTERATPTELLLVDRADHHRSGAALLRLDQLLELPGVSEEDVVAAVVEYVRRRNVLVVSACDLGDRLISSNLGPLSAWGAVASIWPRGHG